MSILQEQYEVRQVDARLITESVWYLEAQAFVLHIGTDPMRVFDEVAEVSFPRSVACR